MSQSYGPELWRDLFVMLGSSATALLGLLFVVLTIHLQTVKEDLDFRLRTRNNSYHLLNVFILSALTLAPQPAVWLGIEVALVCLYGLRAGHRRGHRVARRLEPWFRAGGHGLRGAHGAHRVELVGAHVRRGNCQRGIHGFRLLRLRAFQEAPRP